MIQEVEKCIEVKDAELVAQLEIEFAQDLTQIAEAEQACETVRERRADHDGKIAELGRELTRLQAQLGEAVADADDARTAEINGKITTAEQALAEARRIKAVLPDASDALGRLDRLQKGFARRVTHKLGELNLAGGGELIEDIRLLALKYLRHKLAMQKVVDRFGASCGEALCSASREPDLRLAGYRGGHPVHDFVRALRSRNLQWIADEKGRTSPQ